MKFLFILPLFLFISFLASAQQNTRTGPIIKDFGGVFQVNNPDFKTDTSAMLKVVFDVGRASKTTDRPNALITTAARFLNMHAQNGVKLENMRVALVIHGSAAQDILTNKAYRKQFGTDNPNAKVIEALNQSGVQVILCGQTAAYRNITREKALPQVKFALSAMTALVQLQNTGYRLINF